MHEKGKGGRAPSEGKEPRGLHQEAVLLPSALAQRVARWVRPWSRAISVRREGQQFSNNTQLGSYTRLKANYFKLRYGAIFCSIKRTKLSPPHGKHVVVLTLTRINIRQVGRNYYYLAHQGPCGYDQTGIQVPDGL